LEEKKGENILLLDIREQAYFADYFIICTGTSDRMLRALGDAVGERVDNAHDLKTRFEGVAEDGWLLLDYGDIIVHLFSPDRRNYYRLEELWSAAKVLLHLQ
jgi:ribosome-associated protein